MAMATAKMKIILPLVVWIWLHTSTGQSFGGIGYGIRREVFFLNLEDGYFGCQVNESTDVLQLFELSKLCDGIPNCFLGSDELQRELKCTDDCREEGTLCRNGACLNHQCHCNDGFGGCSCEVPDENECKYRPCDVFAHCTNTLGSFSCTCFPGYEGDGFQCKDIDECADPAIASRCVENAECCNVPAHFLCKCLPGFEGDGESQCLDINECLRPDCCGQNAICANTFGNYTCNCPEGYGGNPYDGCVDLNECDDPRACGPGGHCTNLPGGKSCTCPPGYEGDAYTIGCYDANECSRLPCGRDAQCTNLDGSFRCACPPGFIGDPAVACTDLNCYAHGECPTQQACINGKCQNPCTASNPCQVHQECQVQNHQPICVNVCQCQRHEDCGLVGFVCDGCNCVQPHDEPVVVSGCEHCPPGVPCDPTTGACIKEPGHPKSPKPCESDNDCFETEACFMSVCQDPCEFDNVCAATAKCQAKMHRPICTCPMGYEGNPANKCFKSHPIGCTSNNDCPLTEACINQACQRPCDLHNPCAQHAVCVNTNHGTDCSCAEGFQGNGFLGCVPVEDHKSVCQYNEDCPPNKLCDRLNRICMNPCFEDSCGENAECIPQGHGIHCQCLPGFAGNAYILCDLVHGCQSDRECGTTEACINAQCTSPCRCGINAICDVIYHQPTCKCPLGYTGNAQIGCNPPSNPCDPNPCGVNALCEIDNGNPICFCPKGLTGNPFKNCIPEGGECTPNPCGSNSGCRLVGGKAVCFCLPEFEGAPPLTPCALPEHPCNPSPCGPNTQCSVLENGFAKCTCLHGYLESPNTIRGCVEQRNPCDPNPCGFQAQCDPHREPICFCPYGLDGNPFRSCAEPVQTPILCQPGPCGLNSDCYVTNNQEQCFCRIGFIGDPYNGCRPIPPSPCLPNPCSYGAICIVTPEGQPMCQCPAGLGGDPTGPGGCHGYECLDDKDCSASHACIGHRCRDPCPGSCGLHAHCRVEQHHPVCTCNPGLTGNSILRCFPVPIPLPPNDPCMPNPCGLNTICQVLSGRAVCSCLPDFVGDPQIGCQPECVINSDCPLDKACFNHHCKNPCDINALCGITAVCQVEYHTAICYCPEGYTGDPFIQCLPRPIVVVPISNVSQPCLPSPCGDYQCDIYGTQVAICDPCLRPNSVYNPQCRPECLTNVDCPFNKACLGSACSDPCPGSCGVNAECAVINHTPVCSCAKGLYGNPFEHCSIPQALPEEKVETCENVRCGSNAVCAQNFNALSCTCKKGFFGNPWIACRPECVINPDCSMTKACINNKCVDPCHGACGVSAQCEAVNHIPICFCPAEHTGDPFVSCFPYRIPPPVVVDVVRNPCDPSPCGPFSRCILSPQGFATCSCLPQYKGSPPACQPECIVSSECPQNRACVNQKCVDPCPGTCGLGAFCTVINHNPICTCPEGQHGDPFISCYSAVIEEPKIPSTSNPCVPSPCGPNSICQVKQGRPVCSCVANFIGSPPYCRPECVINQECPQNKACIKEKCIDPCVGNCGQNAKCDVVNHTPFCSCLSGYEGDAFVGCSKTVVQIAHDPCNPSPCGENSQCSVQNGLPRCNCIPPYIGNPYAGGCRPECTINPDCPSHLACLAQHCRDPCQGLCGFNAECSVVNHIPVCNCVRGFIGDPFTSCKQEALPVLPSVNPCDPSPCGPNSVCRVSNNHAICSCKSGFIGAPPSCKPECSVTSECALNKACIQNKCRDPCPGTCGLNARCQTTNHNPICSCPPQYTGDPFVQCLEEEARAPPPPSRSPCIPSPCGPNAECRVIDTRPVCSCVIGMFGAPPNCRPECVIHQDCPLHLACVNTKCKDPCAGSCGFNAKCTVRNHQPVCSCLEGFEGDPFAGCNMIPIYYDEPVDPCYPNPCGSNAVCKESNGVGSCTCLVDYFGDAYSGCKPECITNNDCPYDRACLGKKCRDPCPGSCGLNAECHCVNHKPSCSCIHGYTGDPLTICKEVVVTIIEEPRRNPCVPSPCGPFSICQVVDDRPVCSCNVNYFGAPPNCRPECIQNSECAQNKACYNQKCTDPCPGTCGINAQCRVVGHSPICSCPPHYVGDPFSRCILEQKVEVVLEVRDHCTPSPCGHFAECRTVQDRAVCTCLPNYFGQPPHCKPECIVNSECAAMKTCVNQRCVDPCPGSCGSNADCKVVNHGAVCYCIAGFIGDPFSGCQQEIIKEEPRDPCNPSPCGYNAICKERNGAGSCTCLPEYFGDPYSGCRPECVQNSDCPRDKTCTNNKCRDPCPGTCGLNAECRVNHHIPTCSCFPGYTGDPTKSCHVIPIIQHEEPKSEPSVPSPCGPYSQCRVVNGHAVCSCQQNYIGTPPACRPECVVSAECAQDKACINQRCQDPCPGTCGLNARCQVTNHNPICSCSIGFTGDPFTRCLVEHKPPIEAPRSNPCVPSPCGPNSQCRVINEQGVCSCLPNFVGRAPNCRPECTINEECPGNLACINEKCRDPCPGSCGTNTQCSVIKHSPVCQCVNGYTGDPFAGCRLIPIVEAVEEVRNPCNPSPCGANSVCKERNGAGSCICLPEYFGDPYIGCKPECVINPDCAKDKSCLNNKCKNPCPGTCGINAECSVYNHAPSCYCLDGYTGNPMVSCHRPPPQILDEPEQDPCRPSPCGPYSQCREINGHAVCSCLANYIGAPPSCRPECMISADCPLDKACVNMKCTDPCPGTCGLNARCMVVNHNPICSCPQEFTGDPFVRCIQVERRPEVKPQNPCVPSPCGPNSQCRVLGNTPACSCLANYVGRPPSCRPECAINAECPSNVACINEKCVNPCPGSCGSNAECVVINHKSVCSCVVGFTGDPFGGCVLIVVQAIEEPRNPCNPSPCGANAVCSERDGAGSCTCLPEYYGDPYTSCRPECVTNSDCARDKACTNNKCKDPCPGICGINAECTVSNHAPACNCLPGYEGNPLASCTLLPPILHEEPEPCVPSPCGPYSQCRVVNGHAVCSCLVNYIGTPPACRPECMVSAECPQDKACINQKCRDPCPGTCGLNARCQVINHNPICSCTVGYVGDPFTRCIQEERRPVIAEPSGNPCVPSPCGPNSQCRVVNNQPACSCLQNYIGRSPNCRPECTINADCPGNRACQNEKCVDPCPGSCGRFTSCRVLKHSPVCMCLDGYTGDPFSGCNLIPIKPAPTESPRNPCNPSPCGANAICKEHARAGSCICLADYFGDPYTGCRPECVTNSDCDRSRACVNNKCKDPCPGTCGINAECVVFNHAPSCFCIDGYTGEPSRACRIIVQAIEEEPSKNPCVPSPCGPYSKCREVNNHAVCSCNAGYIGTPPMCKPECIVSSECPQTKACVSQKCVDPCPGTCGLDAKCQVINHNPICSCPPGYTGDPFLRCALIPLPSPPKAVENPCVPSPCGPYSQCRVIGDQPACSCLPNYIGRSPNCRPECLANSECPNNLACQNEKCINPCPGSCGTNAICTVVNHNSICSCLPGYIGDALSACHLQPSPSTERAPPATPCFPSPCGPNAECRENNGAGACLCPIGYLGNPYDKDRGCHRECEINSDCNPNLACISYKCSDPCPGTCGTLAECHVANHVPTCNCIHGFTGDPFFQCREIVIAPPPRVQDPCNPSPCGPNSQCRNVNDHGVCSCLPNYMGTPPNCRPECVVNSECNPDKACVNQKCADPCPNTCGLGAQCYTKNHNPICACPPGFTGDPFIKCIPQPVEREPLPTERPPSCAPSPCGPNSLCQMSGGVPSCSCLPNFIGAPPSCRPECVINSECGGPLACINQKCRDPCPGSCGSNAKCHVLNHVPVCSCDQGFTGDPFSQCSLLPPPPPRTPNDPCNPSPCGPNAQCNNGICTCLLEYIGNPYETCRPECVQSSECSRDKACVRNKCKDPCPGTCGQNARCDVINHIPVCSCPEGFTGDPFTNCRVQPPPRPLEKLNPCNPSPCGPNSQCRQVNGHAVCSCIQSYIGSPPNCRPECIVSAECPPNKACVNQKCTDPCLGSCGIGSRCEVINHSPICSCPEGQTGDPFVSCREQPRIPDILPEEKRDPCVPTPCGPNSICRPIGDSPSCSCLASYIGQPPNCRPECVINPDCPSTQACINNKCKDPCPGSCGDGAECRVINHMVTCTCSPGFTGNAFVQCVIQKQEDSNPCQPSPCGANALCKERGGAGSCMCLPEYVGNPYEGCRPECVLSSDCPTNKACIRNKCVDPCPGICGQFADCNVVNHVPTCKCIPGYIGDPFSSCRPEPPPLPITEATVADPCNPSPCGPNGQCRNINDHAVCSCLPEHIGTPPNCRPECVVSSECPQDKACHKFKCANPCRGTCGVGARCEVINHNPICSCPSGLTGDPFTRCYAAPVEPSPPPKHVDPCVPTPCGTNSICRVVNEQASCSCLPNFVGAPPNCRPECVVNTDCPSNLACITDKCKDPCPGSCGFNAECRVQNHLPICSCITGYTGDPFTQCAPKIEPPKAVVNDPCNPSPCGPNAQCRGGLCTCFPEYGGDPYVGCRPECTMNTDCSPVKACKTFKCIDPCPGTCGQNSKCDVVNHIPTCSCLSGYEGDPFTSCRLIVKDERPRQPCNPSPCGPNSVCKVVNTVAVCSCQTGTIGSPPSCRPECIVSQGCPLTQACLNNKCVDPCPGTCGVNARCQVVNHNPICSCMNGNTGDPFTRCYPIVVEEIPRVPLNPCVPSPCGPSSVCQVRGESPACSCLETFVGAPPNCRPECTINPECASNRACVNQKCRDPCPGSCGSNAQCAVVNHSPVCSCVHGFTGDPFNGCYVVPAPPPPGPVTPCQPSPCGTNARCRSDGLSAICECLTDYRGNPYDACRPECTTSADCPATRACVRQKCRDPCVGTCGVNARCDVSNHVPMCSCPAGYEGDGFRVCTLTVIREEPPIPDPCHPSPCGINTRCEARGPNAICTCLPDFFGAPSVGGCRPECTISADCALNRACSNMKCIDPCPGTCGYGANCQVVNHSPVCSCPPPLIGDPFTLCHAAPSPPPPSDPCQPSPCRAHGQCIVRNGLATCLYPECVINQDCPRDRACYGQKCGDPCRGACGTNALCQAVNHRAVCVCPEGYIGRGEVECSLKPADVPRPECIQDSECATDKSCINQQCRNPCAENPNICTHNADCRVQSHRTVCNCRDGFTGNPNQACYEIGCRADTDCPSTESCLNRNCIDPCSYIQCGINALCRPDGNHRARCYCPEHFRGDPQARCDRPQCVSDDECPDHLTCRNERCEDPCNCGVGAECSVQRHRAECRCPVGWRGNPVVSCERAPVVIEYECRTDANCASKLACFNGNCKNPCLETKPCGRNAECSVVDTLPLRTMSCQCLPGYVGDADTECKQVLQEQPGCKTNDDCPLSEFCTNRLCLNPCSLSNPCAKTAECHATSHKAVCRCPAGLIGDPFVRCSQPVQDKPECTSDLECSNDRACISERCQDPCVLANPCGASARCRTNQHRPTCQCPDGWGGNPQVQCYKPECKVDTDCPYQLACIQESCLNPCSSTSCGRGAQCHVLFHRAQCQCPTGTQGNPLVSCIAGVCQYNEDCADHEACDRLNRVCRDVCEVEDSCADTATCIGQAHQPKCSCPPGLTGNPYVECLAGRQPVEAQPECRTDGECTSKSACINQRCQDPCSISNICTVDQECRVLDTLPLRTVMCQCPSDTFVDSNGRCRPIQHEQVECHVDSECTDRDKCIRGSCIEACRVDQCGINAQCISRYHQAACACAPGYTGNAHVECSNIPKIPIPIPIPECYSDSDCTYDKTCRNEFCVNPCTVDRPCALGAFCSAKDHKALCNCPVGYEGNPKIDCIAPLGPAVGCKSNSDCARSEHCFNTRCVNPCNCGENAECKVLDHYPICYCRPGYSGNPQTGCIKLECTTDKDCLLDQQCHNSQCINPCILGDPCASTAECYGSNHRAACRCPTGYSGNAYDRCERVECHSDPDCPSTRTCLDQRCVDPCSAIANPPCSRNAICYAQNHAAGCICPGHLPEGNPFSYCQARVIVEGKPECVLDPDCPSKMACIKNTCVNPCEKLSPCHRTAHCSVLDTIPVRTMICTCPEGWVPNLNGECHAVIIPIPPGCSSDTDCPSTEACINRMCRNPCQCGSNSACFVQNHRPICSCEAGYEGNPNIACRTVGCRSDSECDSAKACVNGNCINPCLVRDTCGINAECYVYRNRAECRCFSGYRGNAMDRCVIVGCTSNSDCPNDRQCINAQCINPCVYDNPCAPRAECKVQNHRNLCRCAAGFLGNPYVECRREPQPECREDSECPARLACLSNKCQDPCRVLEPCHNPAECQVVPSLPVRTMICVCPPGYISSGSGTCVPTLPVKEIGGCVTDKDCSELKSCVQGICKDPCNCGLNSECRIKNHKPVCTCKQGYDGNPEIECVRIGCRSDDQCSGQHTCVNKQCVPVCASDKSTCGRDAECIGINHRAICQCPAGFMGNPKLSCVIIGCRADAECPMNRACINSKCETPCSPNPCQAPSECRVHSHKSICACPAGFYGDGKGQCVKEEEKCMSDIDCPSKTACINAECVNPCLATKPCGVNAECRVLDTEPVRTMICECLPGYQGNAAVQCDKIALCRIDKGYIRTPDGSCVCPPNTGLNENEECILCPIEKGLKIDERGRCVCALERGLIIDERGNCVCPTEFGYRLDIRGNCVPTIGPECETDSDCADNKFCNPSTKTCDDPCLTKHCGVNAFCNATNHRAVCQCITKYTGDPEVVCSPTSPFRTDFPRPEMLVSCLSDGVQVEIHITEQGFNGVLYVKGHSKDEQCRRVVTLPSDSIPRTEIFKVHFGNCGLIHVNGQASFVLVIQKHPKLVTYKAQAYHIKCVYQTGEQNVTLGFNVSMLTTAGTIANTGPPPTCIMKIITPTGQEINSAEIGDNLMLQVDVQPGSIYGGFARSCVAKTMEDNVENEYLVTDENGCATDPTIFGEWEYNAETQSLLASFNAFKFPSSDNIRFQCNIRVCFGKCQPVNCRGYNAFGRRKRAIDNNSETTDVMLPGAAGDLLNGQLREEITIQSNAILTFERREERFTDPQEVADAQRVEDICVSMIGFIIALIITALLALVAVAVAVSCWLMAYRRRPKPAGPLPHPPEFPNPLFTTPEPMAEPSPDYLT